MRNRYRAAKKFKLDEDYEVVDAFTSRAKKPIKDNWWDYGGKSTGSYYRKFPCIHRWLGSRVGMKWDDVFSEYIRFSKNQSPITADWLRERIRWTVYENTYVVSGVRWYNAQWGGRALWNGEFYVEDGILCREPYKKKERYPRTSYKKEYYGLETIEVGEATYVKKPNHYTIRVAPGVFKEVEEWVWLRHDPYNYQHTFYTYNTKTRQSGIEVQTLVGTKVSTASKKEKKKFNLK